MFDKLSSLFADEVKDAVKGKLTNDEEFNNNADDDTVKAGTSSIFESLKDELAEGKLDDIIGVLKNRSGDIFNNPIVKSLISKATGKLSAAKGLDNASAEKVVKNTLPEVMNKMEEKDADDSAFSMDSMMGVLKGDKEENGLLSDLTSNITGGLGGLFK